MSSRLLPLLLGSLVGCSSGPKPEADVRPRADFDCTLDPFSDTFGRAAIDTLAHPDLEGRRFDSEGLLLAVDFVEAQFACIGLTPGAPALAGLPDDSYRHVFETAGDEVVPASDILDYEFDPEARFRFTSLLGSIPGSGALADEVIVVGAHVDHLGRSGAADGQLVLGADDNASGVTALLALARHLIDEPPAGDRRTIVFAAWGVEEDPFYLRASQAFFADLDDGAEEQVMFYVNFDMVGGYAYHEVVYALGAYSAAGGFEASPARVLLEDLVSGYPELNVSLDDVGTSSDQVTFCLEGIPYVFFFTEDDCYHTPCDTPENIDYESMARIFALSAELVAGLAVAPDLAPARAAFPDAYAAAYAVACTD